MTIENYPVWPFEPNWTSSVRESLEWLTDVLMSPTGAEQRRSLRFAPRRVIDFTVAADGDERALLDNLLATYSAQDWYLPIWYDVTVSTGASALAIGGVGSQIPCVPSDSITVGTVIFIAGDTPFDFQVAEVATVTSTYIVLTDLLDRQAPIGSLIYPMTVGRLMEQPQISAMTNGVVTAEPQFLITQTPIDSDAEVRVAGPMIVDGLIVNAYHQETGRGGYFHHNSGTSEGQFIFIYGLYLAYEQLIGGTGEQQETALYFKSLAEEMLDAMGDGEGYLGPMLRQPVSESVDTITLLHWLFAARGDIPGQRVLLSYEVAPNISGKLVIPVNANGEAVFKVWQIYPGTSELLYENPFSPAFDIVSPAGETQILLTDEDWTITGDRCVITIPSGAPEHDTWKIVFGYTTSTIIPMGFGYEAFPNWTAIPSGYSACAPDTFRWFEQAMQKAIEHDAREGKAERWTNLQLAMRRTAVKGQNITDLREVFEPMPGFDAIPVGGAPDGMYCYSTSEEAKGPSVLGANPNWRGYDFWSRDDNGLIIGQLPKGVSQIGRGFADQWRSAETYQDADQYLYVRMGYDRALEATEHVRVYISSTQAYDPATRWFADVSVTPSGGVSDVFIPRASFKLATNFDPGAGTTWGSTLPVGTTIQNFGVEVAADTAINIKIHSLRLVADDTAEAVAGSKMPFFPGAMPFAINADLKRQRFVGWNGSPFHGYQLPDHWWWLSPDASAIHGLIDVSDLPVADTDGSIIYPISPTTTGGAVAKVSRALLMEQQLLFLKKAQEKYAADGGPNGFFAHTFVLNTPARASLGNPTPHSWVYVNDDPNTRWVGYQTRVVESLAELLWLTRNDDGFADARSLALTMVEAWMTRINVLWPDLTGTVVGSRTIYGMPTDFPDPAISDPETLYEEPHAAAHVLRACLILKKTGVGTTARHNALISRCWAYLEMMWRTSGEMRYTWSPAPAQKQWYGFWHGEIITTLALMLDNPTLIPEDIDIDDVADRLVQTREWIEVWGVGKLQANAEAGLIDEYRNFHVFNMEPDWSDALERSQQRLLDVIDTPTGMDEQVDTALRPFPTQQHKWVLDGKDDHATFYALMQALRGRAVPVWVPSWMDDMRLAAPASSGATTITVGRCGYTLAGGPRPERQDIMIELVDGTALYRRITESAADEAGLESLALDSAIPQTIAVSDVLRISFMSLMRLDHDSIEIDHLTDLDGVSEVQVTFRAAPDLRQPVAAFYEV